MPKFDDNQRQLLQEDIFHRLALNSHFDTVLDTPASHADYDIDITLNQINHCFRLTFTLDASARQQQVLSAILPVNGQPICQQHQFNRLASSEINAAIRTAIQHGKRLARYKHALNIMDFRDLEQLVQASYHAHKKVDIQNAMDTLLELKQKYPNSPDVLGLLAQSYLAEKSLDLQDQAKARQQALDYAPASTKAVTEKFRCA